jgi:anti-anti-sigma regulatory factor
VAVEDVDSARVTRLPREIDVATRGAAEADLLAAVSAPGLVIADMTGTASCDSAGVRMLVAAHNRARSRWRESRDGPLARSRARAAHGHR